MAKRAQIGDIIEIPTKVGLAYAQYTHQNDQFGGLIRVFSSIHDRRPVDFSRLINEAALLTVFFPFRAAINKGIFVVVSNQEIAEMNKTFPLFRDGVADPKTKEVAIWWLWDGEKEWRVGSLTNEQQLLPLRRIVNDTRLIELIEAADRREKN